MAWRPGEALVMPAAIEWVSIGALVPALQALGAVVLAVVLAQLTAPVAPALSERLQPQPQPRPHPDEGMTRRAAQG